LLETDGRFSLILITKRINAMTEKEPPEEESENRVEWLKKLYAEWKAKQEPEEHPFLYEDYLDDDFNLGL